MYTVVSISDWIIPRTDKKGKIKVGRLLLKIIAVLVIVEWVLIILVTLGFMISNIIDFIEDIISGYKSPDFKKVLSIATNIPIDDDANENVDD